MKTIKGFKNYLGGCITLAVIIVLLAILVIFGKEKETFSCHQLEKYASDFLTEDAPLTGNFVPQRDYIKNISFIFNREAPEASGSVVLSLYDEFGDKVAESYRVLSELTYGYMEEFPINCKLHAGESYTFILTPMDYGNYPVSVDLAALSCGTGEITTATIGNKELSNAIPLTETIYQTHIGKRNMLPYMRYLHS